MADEITFREDILDSRDVIARIEELQEERADLLSAVEDAGGDDLDPGAVEQARDDARAALAEWDESSSAEELAELLKLQDQLEGYTSDWRHGACLIADHYFETHARELAEDIGAVNRDGGWPNTCIDWKQAAEELQQDYTSADAGGRTWWVR